MNGSSLCSEIAERHGVMTTTMTTTTVTVMRTRMRTRMGASILVTRGLSFALNVRAWKRHVATTVSPLRCPENQTTAGGARRRSRSLALSSRCVLCRATVYVLP